MGLEGSDPFQLEFGNFSGAMLNFGGGKKTPPKPIGATRGKRGGARGETLNLSNNLDFVGQCEKLFGMITCAPKV